MASGLPDFYRSVDVAKQSLGEIINRPKYGGAVLVSGFLAVQANVTNFLLTVLGKGMIYAGSVWLDHTSTQANSQVWLETEAVQVTDLSFLRLKDYGINNPRSALVSLNVYDGTNYIYSVGLSYGVTFETRVDLVYKEEHGATPTVHFRFVYALL